MHVERVTSASLVSDAERDALTECWVVLRRSLSPLIAHWGSVERLQTHPRHRGRATGALLLGELERHARDELGLTQLHLAVRGGLGLEEYYRRRGWHEVGRWPGPLRLAPGDDRDDVLMLRRLPVGVSSDPMTDPDTTTGAAPGPEPRLVRVPVRGGDLTVAVWDPRDGSATGPAGPPETVLCLHGITSSHKAFLALARRLPGRRLVAPDLRGRGGSAGLGGPHGMAAHADDLRAVLSHLGLGRVRVVGHSMGGFVAVVLAHRAPDLVDGLVLVDGGLPIPTPPGLDPDALLQAVIGPAAERLAMRFASREDYRAFWRQHPALADDWGPDVESYVDYDLVGRPPELRPSASYEAVRDDSTDLHAGSAYADALTGLAVPAIFLGAERGMLNEPQALIPDEAVQAAVRDAGPGPLTSRRVAGVNHYTIVMSERGAAVVAAAVVADGVDQHG